MWTALLVVALVGAVVGVFGILYALKEAANEPRVEEVTELPVYSLRSDDIGSVFTGTAVNPERQGEIRHVG